VSVREEGEQGTGEAAMLLAVKAGQICWVKQEILNHIGNG
jgi:hypothetical protein